MTTAAAWRRLRELVARGADGIGLAAGALYDEATCRYCAVGAAAAAAGAQRYWLADAVTGEAIDLVVAATSVDRDDVHRMLGVNDSLEGEPESRWQVVDAWLGERIAEAERREADMTATGGG